MDKKILDLLNIPVVVCNNNGNVTLVSKNALLLWGIKLDLSNINNYSLIEVLEIIREGGKYPEPYDFRDYANKLLNIATNYTNYSSSNKLLLPNGIHLEENIIKQNNIFIISWNDITEQTSLNYQLTWQKQILHKIIERNPNAVLIVNSDSSIEEYNFKFSQLFNISKDILNTKPSIKSIIPQIFNNIDTQNILGLILKGKSFNESYNNINIYATPLQNNSLLVYFIPNHNTTNNIAVTEQSLIKLNNALDNNLENIITLELSSIVSLSQLLQTQTIGKLNIRQIDYINTINSSAQKIEQQLQYKNTLTKFNNTKLDYTEVNLNTVIATIMHWLKPSLDRNNVTIKLNINNLNQLIYTNNNAVTQMLHLALLYVVLQNNNSDVELEVNQDNNGTNIHIKDTAKAVLFNQQELDSMYNIKLIFAIAKQLKCSVKYYYKNRAFRIISFTLPKKCEN